MKLVSPSKVRNQVEHRKMAARCYGLVVIVRHAREAVWHRHSTGRRYPKIVEVWRLEEEGEFAINGEKQLKSWRRILMSRL